jgi:hypothetical protein
MTARGDAGVLQMATRFTADCVLCIEFKRF